MPIKSILVHLANDPGHAGRLDVALDLARRHGAVIRALFAEPTGRMPDAVAGRGFSYAFVSESREAAQETAARVSKELAAACGRDGIGCTWIDEPGEPMELIARFATLADLVVVGRNATDRGLESEVCEELPARVPCPVLTVPEGWPGRPVARQVLIAWKDGLPSARAVHGALPMLRRAERVTVLTVGGEERRGGDLVDYLALHGVRALARHDYGDDDDPGDVILSVAGEIAADLVIMGSYSRSRFREMILGGATRHVVTHMRVPILFAH
jgi:nucleotide-binding universal stress UspA family protein